MKRTVPTPGWLAGLQRTATRLRASKGLRLTGKIAAWTAGGLVSLLVVAAGGLYFFVTSDYFRGEAASYAGAYTGRKTHIAKVTIDWGATTHVHLSGVEIANPAWAKGGDHMLKAAGVDFELRLWPLIKGDLVLSSLRLDKPEVFVETGDNEQSNWSFAESPVTVGAAEALAPNNRFQMPLIGKIEVNDGKLSYRDPKRKLELDGAISTATGQAGDADKAELSLKGKLEGQPLTVKFVGGSALMLRDTTQPYPVDLDVAFGATKLKLKGTLQDPFTWAGPNVQLTIAGPNMSEIYPLLGIPGPPTPPYQITGKLEGEPGVWRFTQTKWRVGRSDLTGDVVVDERKKPAFLTAKLVSQSLYFADLAPLVGLPPGPSGSAPMSAQQAQTQQQLEASGDLFPSLPLHMEKLRAMNMDVTLDAKKVIAPSYLPVQALSFRVLIDNGRATVKPLALSVIGGGTVAGELGIDARTDSPRVSAALRIADVELKNFFRESRCFDTTQGKVRGRVNLAGTGKSLAQVMSGADGHVEVAMGGGSVSSLMVSLAGLQIFDALVLYVVGDNRIPIACALGRMNFQKGNIVFDRTLLDTQKSVLRVTGQVSLPQQALSIEIKSDRKGFDLLDLHGPVVVEGKLRNARVSLRRVIPIPTPVIGDAKAVACEQVTRELFSAP